MAPRLSPNRAQIDSHVRGLTAYIVNVDGKMITVPSERLEQTVASYVLDLDVGVRDLLDIEPGEKVAYSGFRNLASSSIVGQQREMMATMAMSPGREDPLDHYVLSWSAGETPSKDEIERVVDIVLDVLGLTDHQVIFGAHSNTDNFHLHVAVNKVHPETFERVQPGSGRQIYALHQAVAIVEFEQGWARNQGAMFIADDHGVVHCASGARVRDANGPIRFVPKVQRDKAGDDAGEFAAVTRSLSDGARQHERAAGEWSLERRAKMIAGPIIRRARSADEMHADLAEEGMGYEARGSGAVVTMGAEAIKATTAWRGASIANLEKRWGSGAYSPRLPGMHYDPSTPRTLRIEEHKRHDHYDDEKQLRWKARWLRKAEIVSASDAALDAIDAQAAAYCADIDQHHWAGRGDELNVARAVVGAGRAAARSSVAAVRTEALDNLKASSSFPVFAHWAPWLPTPPLDDVAPGRSAILTSHSLDTPAVPRLLPHHVGKQAGRECHYFDASGKIAFRDFGSTIVIDEATELEVVKDVLRLANAKWGPDKIVPFGDRAFLRLLAKAAIDIDLNLEIKNPTVAQEMKRLRKAAVAKKAEEERAAARRAATASPHAGMPPRSEPHKGPAPLVAPVAIPPARKTPQPASEAPFPIRAQSRELEELQGLRALRGISGLVDRWVEASLSDPANTALHRALAFAIMQDAFGRRYQEEMVADGFVVGSIIAAQAGMFSPPARSSGSYLEAAKTTLSADKIRDAFDGLFVTPGSQSVPKQTRILASLYRRFLSTDWEPREYFLTGDRNLDPMPKKPAIERKPSEHLSKRDVQVPIKAAAVSYRWVGKSRCE